MRLEALTIQAIPALTIFLLGVVVIIKIIILGHVSKKESDNEH